MALIETMLAQVNRLMTKDAEGRVQQSLEWKGDVVVEEDGGGSTAGMERMECVIS